jgi:hypothetical protein
VSIRITFEADSLDELVAELARIGELFGRSNGGRARGGSSSRGRSAGATEAITPRKTGSSSIRRTTASASRVAATGGSDSSARQSGGGRTRGAPPRLGAAERRRILERKAETLWRSAIPGRRDLIIAIVELQQGGDDTTAWEVGSHLGVNDPYSVAARMARLRRQTIGLDMDPDEPRILEASEDAYGRLRYTFAGEACAAFLRFRRAGA